jgi:hypothetical protein
MNKNLLYLTALLIVGLFAGCKKDKFSTNEVPEGAVTVLAFSPQQITSMKGGNTYEYKLSGSIVAPSQVKMNDCGFIVFGSANPSYYKFGGGSRVGYIELNAGSNVPLTNTMVVMYLVFETGDTIRSDYQGIIKSNLPPPALKFGGFAINPYPGNSTMDCNFSYNLASGYVLQSCILEYIDTKGPYVYNASLPVMQGNYSISTYAMNGMPNLNPGTAYDFRVIVTLVGGPNNSGLPPVTFATPTMGGVTYL